jgi:hypothetical protein
MYELDYSQIVRERFEKPHNAGRLFGPVVTGAAGDEARGTRVELDFRVRDGIVAEIMDVPQHKLGVLLVVEDALRAAAAAAREAATPIRAGE